MSIEEIMREADEDIRREKLINFWKQYSNIIVGGIAVIILIASAYSGWKSYIKHQHENDSYVLSLASIQAGEGKADIALRSLEPLCQKSNSSYQALALLKSANLKASQKKLQEASLLYEKVINQSSFDHSLRQMALLLKIIILVDTAKVEDIIPLIQKLKMDAVFKYSAMEYEALVYQKAHLKDKAKDILQELVKDDRTPHDMRSRASILLASL